MKFIVGLLVGTLGVLAASSLVGFSWQPPTRLAMAPSLVADALPEAAAIKTSEAEVASESEVVTESKVVSELDAAPELPLRSVTIAPLPADPAPREAPEPITRSRAPRPEVAQAEPVRPAVNSNSVAPEAPEAQEAQDAEATAVVWKPFHSEVSATGFARRLSVQLGYPFRALREGPAKYHVVFDYGSDEQRELLREQVKALTGFSVI